MWIANESVEEKIESQSIIETAISCFDIKVDWRDFSPHPVIGVFLAPFSFRRSFFGANDNQLKSLFAKLFFLFSQSRRQSKELCRQTTARQVIDFCCCAYFYAFKLIFHYEYFFSAVLFRRYFRVVETMTRCRLKCFAIWYVNWVAFRMGWQGFRCAWIYCTIAR